MAEAGRQERGRCYKHSPLLGPRRNYGLASETSSLSESFEAPKSYGATRKPLQPPCDYKVVSYELLEGDTLQGIAIKFEVTVSSSVIFLSYSVAFDELKSGLMYVPKLSTLSVGSKTYWYCTRNGEVKMIF